MIPRGHDGAEGTGGRSGNDFLARGGEGYESWAAEGPSGIAAEGGYPGDDVFGGSPSASHLARPARGSRKREGKQEPSGGGAGLLTLLVAAGVGAGLMYFLDSTHGTERRRVLMDKFNDLTRGRGRQVRDLASVTTTTSDANAWTDETAGTIAASSGSMILDAETLEQPL